MAGRFALLDGDLALAPSDTLLLLCSTSLELCRTGSGYLIASPSVTKLAITTINGPLITNHTIRKRHQGTGFSERSVFDIDQLLLSTKTH
jgi:hypothetical protein